VTDEIVPTAPSSPAPARPRFFRRHRWKIVPLALLLLAGGGAALWTLITLKFSYSSGDRIGYVQKLSRKGWICRTWEGELAMTPVPGSAPEIFTFTIPSDAVAKRVSELEGKKVALHYQEKRGIPSSCFGDTNYYIVDVRALPQ
jgi:hypothetical protein